MLQVQWNTLDRIRILKNILVRSMVALKASVSYSGFSCTGLAAAFSSNDNNK
jgi:hypothetical protein